MLKSTIFREYDIRGVADAELLDAGIAELGQAIGTYMQRGMQRGQNPKIMLARDCRLSSERLRNALITGLKTTGCHVTDIGVVPTPLLYYSVFHFAAGGGVMITGSHNPAEYNGFKVVSGSSTIHGEEIQRLREMIERQDFAEGHGSEQFADAITPYVAEISSQFHFDRRIKVVVDAGNGTGGPAFHRILDKLNVDASELFFDMDGRFPNHHPDPTVPKNLDALVAAVLDRGADLGIAFDGDADRIGAVDDKGAVIYGDQLLTIYAREILSRKPGSTIIGEVKCSQQMYDDIRKRGGNGIMWKTGHSLIKSKMKETHAELAGEMSGHMFFADRYYGFDDALYAACRLMEIVSKSGQPLSAQLADLEKTITTPEIRIDCEDDAKFQVVERVTGHFKKLYEVLDVDGARINFPHGWGLVRASNTQPVLVLRFEAATQQMLDRYRAEVEAAVRAAR